MEIIRIAVTEALGEKYSRELWRRDAAYHRDIKGSFRYGEGICPHSRGGGDCTLTPLPENPWPCMRTLWHGETKEEVYDQRHCIKRWGQREDWWM